MLFTQQLKHSEYCTQKRLIKIFVTLSATRTLGIYEAAEFAVLKVLFIEFSYTQSVTKTLGIYQLDDIAVLKSAFVKYDVNSAVETHGIY